MNQLLTAASIICLIQIGNAQSLYNHSVGTQMPPLHGKHWMVITGKPLAATAGAMIFTKGDNAVDASSAILSATCTMWDALSWGGENQVLIDNPNTEKVIALIKGVLVILNT